jgi:hypothetical protein
LQENNCLAPKYARMPLRKVVPAIGRGHGSRNERGASPRRPAPAPPTGARPTNLRSRARARRRQDGEHIYRRRRPCYPGIARARRRFAAGANMILSECPKCSRTNPERYSQCCGCGCSLQGQPSELGPERVAADRARSAPVIAGQRRRIPVETPRPAPFAAGLRFGAGLAVAIVVVPILLLVGARMLVLIAGYWLR